MNPPEWRQFLKRYSEEFLVQLLDPPGGAAYRAINNPHFRLLQARCSSSRSTATLLIRKEARGPVASALK